MFFDTLSFEGLIKRAIRPGLTRRIQQARMPRFTTAHAKKWWSTRDRAAPGCYWKSAAMPAPICGRSGSTGPSTGWPVPIFHQRFWPRRDGVLSPSRVSVGLTVASGRVPCPFADKSFDIALTSVMLVCIGPDAIDASLDEIVRVTRRWLVLCEPWSERRADEADYHPDATYWIRNYRARLEGRADLTSLRHLPREHRIGHLTASPFFKLR